MLFQKRQTAFAVLLIFFCFSEYSYAQYNYCPYYTIKSGDTFFQLSQTYGIPLANIQAANQVSATSLQPGQLICLPTIANCVCNSAYNYNTYSYNYNNNYYTSACQNYPIRSGDTCWNLAGQTQAGLNYFYLLNPGINCYNLVPGSYLCLPSSSYYPNGYGTNVVNYSCSRSAIVYSGNTCYQIAANNGISLDTFYYCNPGIACNNLQIGQTVKV